MINDTAEPRNYEEGECIHSVLHLRWELKHVH